MIHLSKCFDVLMAKALRKFSEFSSSVSRCIDRQINYPLGCLSTKCSATSKELVSKFFDETTFWHLETFVNFLVSTHFSWFLLGSRKPASINCFSWPSKAQMLQHKLCHCIFTAHLGPCCNQGFDTTL